MLREILNLLHPWRVIRFPVVAIRRTDNSILDTEIEPFLLSASVAITRRMPRVNQALLSHDMAADAARDPIVGFPEVVEHSELEGLRISVRLVRIVVMRVEVGAT